MDPLGVLISLARGIDLIHSISAAVSANAAQCRLLDQRLQTLRPVLEALKQDVKREKEDNKKREKEAGTAGSSNFEPSVSASSPLRIAPGLPSGVPPVHPVPAAELVPMHRMIKLLQAFELVVKDAYKLIKEFSGKTW
jgi:hypothetical protein